MIISAYYLFRGDITISEIEKGIISKSLSSSVFNDMIGDWSGYSKCYFSRPEFNVSWTMMSNNLQNSEVFKTITTKYINLWLLNYTNIFMINIVCLLNNWKIIHMKY